METLAVALGIGVGAGLITGERRKADGEGIVMVAIELKKSLKL